MEDSKNEFAVSFDETKLKITICHSISWDGIVKGLVEEVLTERGIDHILTKEEKKDCMKMVLDEVKEEDWEEAPNFEEAAKRGVEWWIDENSFEWEENNEK